MDNTIFAGKSQLEEYKDFLSSGQIQGSHVK
jgi:hypothetical protein